MLGGRSGEERHMLKQYRLLNDCLRELKNSHLPAAEKLKLEVHLYQLKRLLLIDEVAAMVKDDASSESEFMAMYEAFKNICPGHCKAGEVNELMMHQLKMKKVLHSLRTSKEV